MTDDAEKDAVGVEIKILRIKDLNFPPFPFASKIKQVNDNLPNFKFREDDIMLCTYPKTGTFFDEKLIRFWCLPCSQTCCCFDGWLYTTRKKSGKKLLLYTILP